MTEKATASRYLAGYPDLETMLPGQAVPWLKRMRAHALAQFSGTGFPSLREEEWRYTNVSGIEKKLFTPVPVVSSDRVDSRWLDQHRVRGAWSVVLLNGHFNASLSDLDGLPETVTVESLAKALEMAPEQVEPFLGQ